MRHSVDEVAEWLRRWTANPLGSARVGSNPILVDVLLIHPPEECVVHTFLYDTYCLSTSYSSLIYPHLDRSLPIITHFRYR